MIHLCGCRPLQHGFLMAWRVWHKNGAHVQAHLQSANARAGRRWTNGAERARASLCRAVRDDAGEAARLSRPEAPRARLGAAARRRTTTRIAERFAERGYVDDAGYALAKSRSLAGRGYGKRRLTDALRAAGVGGARMPRPLDMPTRKRSLPRCASPSGGGLGPFAGRTRADPPTARRRSGAMIRAGHAFALGTGDRRHGAGRGDRVDAGALAKTFARVQSKVGLPTLCMHVNTADGDACSRSLTGGTGRNGPSCVSRGDRTPRRFGCGGELPPVIGRVKWFDATRGFGFLVCDELDGDVLLHFSVLREHGRRSVPEGARSNASRCRLPRGLQAKRVISIDLSSALPPHRARPMPATDGPTATLLPSARATSSRWRSNGSTEFKGYGFVSPHRIGARGRVRAHGDGAPARSSGIFSRGSGWKRGSRTATRA